MPNYVTCSELQFTFQMQQITIHMSNITGSFTKYGHHGSLMNYTTGISKHLYTQSQQHCCLGL